MASALSTEQTSSRIRIVSNSTFASETRMSPAITSPLSRTRSRISSRFAVPETVGTLCIISQEKTEEIAGDWENPRDSCHRILTSLTTNCQPLIIFFAGLTNKPEGGRSQRVVLRCSSTRNRLSDALKTRILLRAIFGNSNRPGTLFIQKVPQGTQLKVQVFRLQSKSTRYLVDFGFQPHQGLPHLLHLCVA